MLAMVDAAVTDAEARVADLLLVLPLVSALPVVNIAANVREAMALLRAQQASLAALDALVDSGAVMRAQRPVLHRLAARMKRISAELSLCQFTYDRALSTRGKTAIWATPDARQYRVRALALEAELVTKDIEETP